MISFSHFGLGALVLKLNEIIFAKPEIKASLYPLAKGGGGGGGHFCCHEFVLIQGKNL